VQERRHDDSERLGPRLVKPWPDFEHWLARYQGYSGARAGNASGRDRRPKTGEAAANDQDIVRHVTHSHSHLAGYADMTIGDCDL
jgi:hypothetical protein